MKQRRVIRTGRNNKLRQNKILILVILLALAVGYALMSTTLKIDGILSLKGNVWDVHWDLDSLQMTAGSISAPNITLSNDDTQINFSASLTQPGEFYEFTIDAVNAGTVDAMLDSFNATIKDGNNVVTTLPSYITFSVGYEDGNELERFHKLAKREDANTPTRETFIIRLEYDPETEVLPDSDLTFNISYQLSYLQADSRAMVRSKKVLQSGRIFNNVMYNLVYRAYKDELDEDIYGWYDPEYYDLEEFESMIEWDYYVMGRITSVKKATTEEYNAVKNTLSSDELIDLSSTAEISEMKIMATSTAEEEIPTNNRAKIDAYMWFDKSTQTIYYYSPSTIVLPKDSSGMFWGLDEATSIDASGFDTSKVIDMNHMFSRCGKLTSINTTGWNTSKVTDMSGMFKHNSSATSLDLSWINTANVTNMSNMFETDDKLLSINFTGWDTSKVESMEAMFWQCKKIPTLDISNFNTGNVTNMKGMFRDAKLLQTVYVGDNWSTQKVTGNDSSTDMFLSCNNIVGGNGTTYNSSKIDKEYARIDVAGTPGYFSRKTN